MNFVSLYMEPSDTALLLGKIATAKGVAIPAYSGDPRSPLRALVRQHCSDVEVLQYLDALHTRRQLGAPLIRNEG